MSGVSSQCPRCRGQMEQGFGSDVTHGARIVSQWMPGAPEKSFWSGTNASSDQLVPIGTFRCSACGFLESYARVEFAAG